MHLPKFILYPNTAILRRYFEIKDSSELVVFEIERFFTDEKAQKFLDGFTKVITEYGLSEHNDNLLFIVLKNLIDFDDELITKRRQNKYALRERSLANIIAGCQNTISNDKSALSFKTSSSINKSDDQLLNEWVARLILDEIKKGQLPLFEMGDPGYLFSPFGEINTDLLNDYLRKEIKPTENFLEQLKGRQNSLLCLWILHYLNNETDLRAEPDKGFLDKQLNFLYDLLVATDLMTARFFTPEKDYSSKDYMRSNLKAYIRKHNIKGNKP